MRVIIWVKLYKQIYKPNLGEEIFYMGDLIKPKLLIWINSFNVQLNVRNTNASTLNLKYQHHIFLYGLGN